MENITNIATFAKSFYLLGDTLDHCYDCKYCRLNGEKGEEKHYHVLPSDINPHFTYLPVAVNLFYGDPLLQIDNTVSLLHELERVHHKGPVIIITKGDFSKFPDIPFDLDLHIAFSTFGVDSYLDGNNLKRFTSNLEITKKRKYNYKYSIEFRPIIYNVNDTYEAFNNVLSQASLYNLPVGYSGLQGKKESVAIWEREGLPLKPYPGYTFGHKKIIPKKIEELFERLAKAYKVTVFRKTSCLISYVHDLPKDYNAHYYRPTEVGCDGCVMKGRCMSYKEHLGEKTLSKDLIPFPYDIINKENHVCILKKKGICEFPTPDCEHISGSIIHTDKLLTTSDVRVIKWLTGYTVDADFQESPYISEDWVTNKTLMKRR